MITLNFKSEKELASFIERVATPIAKKAAHDAVMRKTGFRVKKETATAQSSYENRSYRGQGNSGVSSIAGGGITVTGSRAGYGGVDVPALTSLLTVLAGLNIVIDKSTA